MLRRLRNEWMLRELKHVVLWGLFLVLPLAMPGEAIATISLATGSFSGDLNADLAIAVGPKGYVLLYLGDGFGGLSPVANQTLDMAAFPQAAASGGVEGDFNGDGLTDLAVASSDAVAIFLGMAPSGFETMPVATVSLADEATGVATADFNNDGILDLAVGTVTREGGEVSGEVPPPPPTEGHVLIFLGVDDGTGSGTGEFAGPVTDLTIDVEPVVPSTVITSISSSFCSSSGGEVTISGELLLDGATVTVDGSDPLQIVSVAPDYTQMVVLLPPLTPPGTHTVSVVAVGTATGTLSVAERVTRLGGFGSVSPPEITYPVSEFPGGGAQIAIVSPFGGEFALGMTITVSSSSTTTQLSGETETFTGFGCCVSAAQPFTHQQANMVWFWVPDGALEPGTYDVSVSNNDVCGGADTAPGVFSVIAQ